MFVKVSTVERLGDNAVTTYWSWRRIETPGEADRLEVALTTLDMLVVMLNC